MALLTADRLAKLCGPSTVSVQLLTTMCWPSYAVLPAPMAVLLVKVMALAPARDSVNASVVRRGDLVFI